MIIKDDVKEFLGFNSDSMSKEYNRLENNRLGYETNFDRIFSESDSVKEIVDKLVKISINF